MPHKFSESEIWRWQYTYYQERGPDAWRSGEVPQYITTNPYAAHLYAQLVISFLRDIAANSPHREPVMIIELGAGPGRFAYHFLKQLYPVWHAEKDKLPPFQYVMTDFARSNIDAWKQHPRLQGFEQMQVLDYAYFNAVQPAALQLERSGKRVDFQGLTQPVVVIANYFLDSLPQDLFYTEEQDLYMVEVESVMQKQEGSKGAGEKIAAIDITETGKTIINEPYYPEPSFNNILEQYVQYSREPRYFLFPHTGLRCLAQLRSFSQQGCLLVTADKGFNRINEIWQEKFPKAVWHGAASYNVNYHAFQSLVEAGSGRAFFPTHFHESIMLGCLLWLHKADQYPRTVACYQGNMDRFGSDDFYILRKHLVHYRSLLHWREIFSLLRMSYFDAEIFAQLVPDMKRILPEISAVDRWNFLQLIPMVWDMYYPLSEPTDLGFDIGVLLMELGFHEAAIPYFRASQEWYGTEAAQQYNLAICYWHCRQTDRARLILEEACTRFPEDEKLKKGWEELNAFILTQPVNQ